MTSNELHWMIYTNQLCPLVLAKPSYIKRDFAPTSNTQKLSQKNKEFSPNIDHLILEGLSVADIVSQIDRGGISVTRARAYVYERKKQLGLRKKSKQTVALELMKQKLSDGDIAERLGMHKRYVRFLRVANSRGRL